MFKFCILSIDEDLRPFLSYDDMDRLWIYFNNLNNQQIHENSGGMTKILCFHGHPFVHYDALTWSFFTYMELKRLRKRFGHPHAEKLFNLLKRAKLDSVDAEI